MKNLLLLMLLVLSTQAYAQDNDDNLSSIEVVVPNIKSADPIVRFELYDNANFLGTPIQKARGKIRDKQLKAYFSNLPNGDYAILCYIDKNNNVQPDKDESGNFSEKTAFSNNPANRKNPNWNSTSFKIDKKTVSIIIDM